jgi:hypothetical protein
MGFLETIREAEAWQGKAATEATKKIPTTKALAAEFLI